MPKLVFGLRSKSFSRRDLMQCHVTSESSSSCCSSNNNRSTTNNNSNDSSLALISPSPAVSHVSAVDMTDELFGAFLGTSGLTSDSAYLDLCYSTSSAHPLVSTGSSDLPSIIGMKRSYERMAGEKTSPTTAVATSVHAGHACQVAEPGVEHPHGR